MAEDSVVYARYAEIVKFVCTFQWYVQSKHLDSGVMTVFPRLVLHPIVKGKVGAEKRSDAPALMADFHVYAYGRITDVAGYVNLYVDYLVSDLIRRGGPLVQPEPFIADMNWRKYIDDIFDRIKKAVQTQHEND